MSRNVSEFKMNSQSNFLIIRLGDSDALSQGDNLYALGFPLSSALESAGISTDEVSVKQGILSRKAILRKNGYEIPSIEISTEIHPGNSGGPLIDNDGEVVGINTYAIGEEKTKQETIVGVPIKFAVEINHIKAELADLKAGMQLLENKTRNETESVIRSRLTSLGSRISESPEISKAISSAYNETSFAYYEKQILAGVDNVNESQENLRKSYLSSISSGYKTIVAGMEVLKNLTQSFNDFYSSNQANLGSISNTFARNKFTEFGNYITQKTNEYDKRTASVYSKISAIDGALKKGNLKELPTSYFTQQRDTFKAEISYIATQKEGTDDRLWIKLLF